MSDGPEVPPADPARLGITLLRANRPAAAVGPLESAAAASDDPYLWSNLGIARQRSGDLAGALAALQKAVDLKPGDADLSFNLGAGYLAGGAPHRAAAILRHAVRLQPGHGKAWNSLGIALSRLGGASHLAEAGAAHRHALACDSGHADAWANLGRLSYQDNQLQLAATCWRQAVASAPDLAEPHLALSILRREMGFAAAAAQDLQRAVARAPDSRQVQTQMLFSLDFDPRQDTASQQRHRRDWAAAFAAAPLPAQSARPDADPERRLRIGYISTDFNTHSAATTFAAAIFHRDTDRFHVTCYDTRNWQDGFNRRFRAAADAWHAVDGQTEASIADLVRRDRIDILVDLSGHTPGHRLGVFLRKPAPLQVTAWGHCTGTGLSQMDALLADPVLVPPHERGLFAETVTDLPCALGYVPFEPPPAATPPAGLAACRRVAPEDLKVTFGSLGRAAKLSRPCVALWAGLLHAVSDSRLFLKDHQYRCRWRRRDIALQFAAQGIDPSRLAFAEGSDWLGHMQAYWQIDMALDTMPHGGGVTTLEALWMGVPVISLYGRFPSGRIAASILTACGHAGWVATDAAGFVATAQQLAARVDGVRAGRDALRDGLARTVPFDPPAYAGAVDAAYRTLWRDWCARRRAGD